MIERLKARKAELTRLREERGATDPILIIAGIAITLILLVGGSFAISGFIANANNLNAKGDLDRIATAQAAFLASNDRYGSLSVGPGVTSQNTELQNSSIGFTPTAGNSTIVRTSPSGWTAVTKSASGAVFVRSSTGTQTYEVPVDATAGAWTESGRNLIRNPSFENDLSGYALSRLTGTRSNAWADSGNYSLSLARTSDANQDAYVDFAANVEGGQGGTGFNSLKTNTTYSVTATYTLTAPLESVPEGTLPSGNRAISVFIHLNGVNVGFFQGPNTVGTHTVTGSFTTPAAFSGVNVLRLYAGDVANAPARLSWDSLGLYEGSQPSYYDGSSAGDALTRYRWTGTPGNSTTIRESRPLSAVQPADLTLPAGISWSDVTNDIQDVYA